MSGRLYSIFKLKLKSCAVIIAILVGLSIWALNLPRLGMEGAAEYYLMS